MENRGKQNPKMGFKSPPEQRKRKARTGFNPKTQEKIRIPAKTVVKFARASRARDLVWIACRFTLAC